MSHRWGRCGRSILLLLLWAIATQCFGSSVLLAAPPGKQSFLLPLAPVAGAPRLKTNGLAVEIDATAWVGTGYCPLRVTVTASATSPANRYCRIRIGPLMFGHNTPHIEVYGDVKIPAGAATTVAMLRVPLFVPAQSLRFDFWEEGQHLPGLSAELPFPHANVTLVAGRPYVDPSSVATVLWPNVSGRFSLSDDDHWQRTLSIVRGANQDSYHPYDLPEAAIDYSQWDAMLISLGELEHVVAKRPLGWQAVRRWVTAGGSLWVFGLGSNFDRLAELNKLLDLPPAEILDAKMPPHAHQPCWHRSPGVSTDTIEAATTKAATTPRTGAKSPDYQPLQKQRQALRERLTPPSFLLRGLGLGQVAALDTSDPTSEHKAYWLHLTESQEEQAEADSRRGVAFQADNPEFWNFLIPGVGLAPIGAFEILITLFVVGIGPLNYFLLRRRHKQSLLIVTVPVGAAAVTASLLLYALVADGLSVRARSRSFTEIDQLRAEAACWSRIAYYAGVQPATGLEFSDETEVYPIDPLPELGAYGVRHVRHIEEGPTRRFTKDWLPARTVTQLLTVRARASSARLEISPATEGSRMRIINQLETRIEQLLIVDDAGKLHWAEAIADGSPATLASIEVEDARDRLKSCFDAHNLEFPDSWSGGQYGLFGARRRNGYSPPSVMTVGHVLEEGIASTLLIGWLPRRSYVAVVERSPEYELGLTDANSEADFHIVLGHW
jgi:hypothetical protein